MLPTCDKKYFLKNKKIFKKSVDTIKKRCYINRALDKTGCDINEMDD